MHNATWDIVVLSHLRWEFVWQRPQHLISRFGKKNKVLFIEEPITFDTSEEGTENSYEALPNVTVVQPKTQNKNSVVQIIRKYIGMQNMDNIVFYIYSPMFEDITDKIPHQAIVYDCMDELSAFRGAPPELINHENILLSKTDIVFTGGKSLYESKKKKHSNVFCFPSSVEHEHFAKALHDETKIPVDMISISHPIAGFYGVIDERIDLKLLEDVAQKNSQISFVMIGPVVKIDPSTLPQYKNIHYLGQKSYDQLPAYLKSFDIAFMPFALNESTQFISPTKTLEFMAAYKPIISTPIADIVRDYADTVTIINNPTECSNALRTYLNETEFEKSTRISKQKQIIEKTSWDATAKDMMKQISRVIVEKIQEKNLRMKKSIQNADIVIVGAGISGAVLAEQYAKSGKKVLI